MAGENIRFQTGHVFQSACECFKWKGFTASTLQTTLSENSCFTVTTAHNKKMMKTKTFVATKGT